jgi:UDPglucose 6-dehydrogenase
MVKCKEHEIVPLFLGLTHIGQVYSKGWSKKVGKCAVFDFNKKSLNKFKKNKFTDEELSLKNEKNNTNIYCLETFEEISKYKIIFFTYDTPINEKNGYPRILEIEHYLNKLLSIKFTDLTYVFVTSQVYPGFMDKMEKKNINNKIKFIYMVDTLKMGSAPQSFLKPEQLIFGSSKDNKKIIKKTFSKFKVKKFIFNFKEAELIKISINLYLFFSVSYANILEKMARGNGIEFSKITNVLKNDKRIGMHAYINPSLGVSGGHLERDSFFFNKLNKDSASSQIVAGMLKFNKHRKDLLSQIIKKITHDNTIRILIIGVSYKKNSFSLTNTIFSKIFKNKKFNVHIFDDQFKKKEIKNTVFIQSLKNVKKYDLIIYNYANTKNTRIINKYMKKNLVKKLINISYEKKYYFKGANIINIFSKAKKSSFI